MAVQYTIHLYILSVTRIYTNVIVPGRLRAEWMCVRVCRGGVRERLQCVHIYMIDLTEIYSIYCLLILVYYFFLLLLLLLSRWDGIAVYVFCY